VSRKAVRLVHVPDVRATVEWYRSIGFRDSNLRQRRRRPELWSGVAGIQRGHVQRRWKTQFKLPTWSRSVCLYRWDRRVVWDLHK